MTELETPAMVVRERALLLEALTLLLERQKNSESTLLGELERTSSRVAALDRRSADLESRLATIDDRLRELASQVEPDPGIARRVSALQAHVQRLQGGERSETTPPRGTKRAASSEVVRRSVEPAPALLREDLPEPRPAGDDQLPTTRRRLQAAQERAWERLGTSNQDRASVVLMGAGVVVVLAAALAQLR